jgi:multimeric flavodoxin WrbA
MGAKAAGHQAEKINLRDLHIGHCLACEHCRQHDGVCVQKDDMAAVLEKMLAADVIVLATPLYFYNMNGQMKTLIDRVYPVYPQLGGKDLYYIMTAADEREDAMATTLAGFRGFASCLGEVREQGVISATGVWKVGDIKGKAAMTQAYEMGKNIGTTGGGHPAA